MGTCSALQTHAHHVDIAASVEGLDMKTIDFSFSVADRGPGMTYEAMHSSFLDPFRNVIDHSRTARLVLRQIFLKNGAEPSQIIDVASITAAQELLRSIPPFRCSFLNPRLDGSGADLLTDETTMRKLGRVCFVSGDCAVSSDVGRFLRGEAQMLVKPFTLENARRFVVDA